LNHAQTFHVNVSVRWHICMTRCFGLEEPGMWSAVAEWLGCRTLNQRVVGSNPVGCRTLNQRVVGSNPDEGTAWYL
jgi:hypothetical protein